MPTEHCSALTASWYVCIRCRAIDQHSRLRSPASSSRSIWSQSMVSLHSLSLLFSLLLSHAASSSFGRRIFTRFLWNARFRLRTTSQAPQSAPSNTGVTSSACSSTSSRAAAPPPRPPAAHTASARATTRRRVTTTARRLSRRRRAHTRCRFEEGKENKWREYH